MKNDKKKKKVLTEKEQRKIHMKKQSSECLQDVGNCIRRGMDIWQIASRYDCSNRDVWDYLDRYSGTLRPIYDRTYPNE